MKMTLPTEAERKGIQGAIEAIERLLADRRSAGVSSVELRTEVGCDSGDVLIEGDTDGLILLAKYVLRVAAAQNVGYHEHIDKASFAREDSEWLIIGRIESGHAESG
jgi:hypothetical protein